MALIKSNPAVIARLFSKSRSWLRASQATSAYVEKINKNWRPKDAPDHFQPWVDKTIGGGVQKRNLKHEADWIKKNVFEPGWDKVGDKWFGCRSTTVLDHSWLTACRGSSDIRSVPDHESWMHDNAIPSMITTLLENGCAVIPDDYAQARAKINLEGIKGIKYGYQQKYNLDLEIQPECTELYSKVKQGTAASLGNNMIRTASDVVCIDLPAKGKMWGVLNAVTSDHAFSGSLTWWRGYDGGGRPFTIVYGGGGDVLPFLQPKLNVNGGELLFAQSQAVFETIIVDSDLRDADYSTYTWNQKLKDDIWNNLDPTTQKMRLTLDVCDSLGGPLKLLKQPAKWIKTWNENEPSSKDLSQIEEFLSERLKVAHDNASSKEFDKLSKDEQDKISKISSKDLIDSILGESNDVADLLAKEIEESLKTQVPSQEMEDIAQKVYDMKTNLKNADLEVALSSIDELSALLKKLDYKNNSVFSQDEIRVLNIVDTASEQLSEITKSIDTLEKQQEGQSDDPVEPIDDPPSEVIDPIEHPPQVKG